MYRGLGTVFTIKTPFGNTSVDLPIDQMANAAVAAAWPPLRTRIESEAPTLINKAWPPLQQKLQSALPAILKQAMPTLKTEEDAIMARVNKTAFLLGATVVASVAGLGALVVLKRR